MGSRRNADLGVTGRSVQQEKRSANGHDGKEKKGEKK